MLDNLLISILLGLIQGIAEWLPISSTAHLKLAETFLGLTATPLFNLILHLGTMSVVIFYFRRDVKNILLSLVRADFRSENGMLIPRIVIATIPTAIIGLAYNLFLQDSFGTIPIIGITFLIGATLVFSTKFAKETEENLPYKTVLIMGVAQGFAIFPGLSRSGVTISAALFLGLKREKAFKFSFLLSIPAIVGDFGVEAYRQRGVLATSGIDVVDTAIALAITTMVGYLAIRMVSNFVRGHKFHYFAFYTWTLGIVLLLASFLLF